MSLSKMPNTTVMYSVHPETGKSVTHKLPYKRDSANLETYIRKGFTFERPPDASAEFLEATKRLDEAPVVSVTTLEVPNGPGKCPKCGKVCKRVQTHMTVAHEVK